MSKLQPVRCGCGGEAEVDGYFGDLSHYDLYYVYCKKCYIQSTFYKTKDEAIQAWNLAMGDFPKINIQKIDTVMPVKCEYYGDKKTVFASGYICPNCYTHVAQLDKYCSECGMKLDWSNYV